MLLGSIAYHNNDQADDSSDCHDGDKIMVLTPSCCDAGANRVGDASCDVVDYCYCYFYCYCSLLTAHC